MRYRRFPFQFVGDRAHVTSLPSRPWRAQWRRGLVQ
jgi:hypothetical protein